MSISLKRNGETVAMACLFPKKGKIKEFRPMTPDEIRRYRLVGEAFLRNLRKEGTEKRLV